MDPNAGVESPAERVREILARVFAVDPATIHEGFGPDDAPLWDSLNHLNMITEVEEAFGVMFPMEEIETMRSYEEVVRAVHPARAGT